MSTPEQPAARESEWQALAATATAAARNRREENRIERWTAILRHHQPADGLDGLTHHDGPIPAYILVTTSEKDAAVACAFVENREQVARCAEAGILEGWWPVAAYNLDTGEDYDLSIGRLTVDVAPGAPLVGTPFRRVVEVTTSHVIEEQRMYRVAIPDHVEHGFEAAYAHDQVNDDSVPVYSTCRVAQDPDGEIVAARPV